MGNKLPLFNLRAGRYAASWHATQEKYADFLILNYKIRKIIENEGRRAKLDISGIVINGTNDLRVDIQTAKPGLALGKAGSNINALKDKIVQSLKLDKDKLHLNLVSTLKPELNARLIAMRVASELEKRRSYNYVIRLCSDDAMRFGALGIHICCSGRLNGAEIARTVNEKRGKISKNTIRANIHYAQENALTRSGVCGVKVWLNLPRGDLKFTHKPGPRPMPDGKSKLGQTEQKRHGDRFSQAYRPANSDRKGTL